MKKQVMMAIALVAILSFLVTPIQAVFIQCTGLVNCFGTANADLINGSDAEEAIQADDGNDVIFGGLTSDRLSGDIGNDILYPGPEDVFVPQLAFGNEGNDTINVFAGETEFCLIIDGNEGFDIANLIGFGPFSVTSPFSDDPIEVGSTILLTDPIVGGLVYINVSDVEASNTVVINGLLSHNLSTLDATETNDSLLSNCEIF
jgi:hypothetical protein